MRFLIVGMLLVSVAVAEQATDVAVCEVAKPPSDTGFYNISGWRFNEAIGPAVPNGLKSFTRATSVIISSGRRLPEEISCCGRTVFSFDERGRIVSFQYDGSRTNISYKTDDRGRILEKRFLSDAGPNCAWVYEYNPDGSFSAALRNAYGGINDFQLADRVLCVCTFDAKSRILSRRITDISYVPHAKFYRYANYCQWGDQQGPSHHGNGKLLAVTTKYDDPGEYGSPEDFRVYREDNTLEILYEYDKNWAMVSKAEYDQGGVLKTSTGFENVIENGYLKWCAPVSRKDYSYSYTKINGMELRASRSEKHYSITYPAKPNGGRGPDFSQDGTEELDSEYKQVYGYEFYEDSPKEDKK